MPDPDKQTPLQLALSLFGTPPTAAAFRAYLRDNPIPTVDLAALPREQWPEYAGAIIRPTDAVRATFRDAAPYDPGQLDDAADAMERTFRTAPGYYIAWHPLTHDADGRITSFHFYFNVQP